MTEQRMAQITLYQKYGVHNPEWKQKNWAELETVLDSKVWRYDIIKLQLLANGGVTK